MKFRHQCTSEGGRRIAEEAGVGGGLQEYGAAVAQNLIEQKSMMGTTQNKVCLRGQGEAFGYGAGVGGFVTKAL